jgi:adenylate cyclase
MGKKSQHTGRIWSWLRGARVAAISAAAGLLALSPLFGGLEAEYGPRLLFRVRGPAAAPAEIVIAAIDRLSADRMGLPVPPRRWPRTVHAELIDTLAKAGATAIVFDLLFTEEGSAAEDGALATAIRNAGNVVLLQDLQRRTLAAPAAGDGQQSRQIDEAIDPIPALYDAAVAVASFPLPTEMPRLTTFWTFLSDTDLPTLPAVVLQLSARDIAEDWARLLAKEDIEGPIPEAWTDRRMGDAMTRLRDQAKTIPDFSDRLARSLQELEPDKARRLKALVALYRGDDSRLLNFFGPAGTVRTIPYASIIDGETPDDQIRRKIVFVGYADREVQSTLDRYETVYSDSSGIDINGVEVLATGVANLMGETSLRTSGAANVLIVIAVALVLGVAAASASDLILGAVSIALLIVVPIAAYTLFVSANFVIPLFTPLAIQLPVGILTIGLSLKSAERKLRRAMESAAHQFLPSDIASRLALGPLTPSAMPASRIASAIFLATDVKGFTTLAERVSPEQLDELAKDYFGPLFEAAKRHGGEILNMTADSMMCAFHIGQDAAQARCNAVAAALDMATLVEEFGARHPSSPMPTRFGLRAGSAAFGVVGSSGRYVTTVVGDVTNTASRIDSLNKLLKTTVLASAEVLSNVEGLIVRPLGTFAPVGKTESVDVVEILAYRGEDHRLTALAGAFAVCLAAFDGEGWSDAAKWFRTLHEQYPDDGPTQFFLDLAVKYSEDPPPAGTARPIRVDVK